MLGDIIVHEFDLFFYFSMPMRMVSAWWWTQSKPISSRLSAGWHWRCRGSITEKSLSSSTHTSATSRYESTIGKYNRDMRSKVKIMCMYTNHADTVVIIPLIKNMPWQIVCLQISTYKEIMSQLIWGWNNDVKKLIFLEGISVLYLFFFFEIHHLKWEAV